MSNIILKNSQMSDLNDYFNEINIATLNKDNLSKILGILTRNQIKYVISNKGRYTAIFMPSSTKILISIDSLKEWIYNNSKDLESNIDSEILNKYLLLFVLTHEIEHSNQHLMSKKIIECNNMLSNAYSEIFNLMEKKHYYYPMPVTLVRRLISKMAYKNNQNSYFVERNANIEATDFVRSYAIMNDREDVYNLFNSLNHDFIKIGYIDSNIGSIEETFKNIHMYDKYLKIKEDVILNNFDLAWYGFNIDEDEREYILKRK